MNAGSDVSSVTHVPSSDGDVLAIETNDVLQPGDLVASRQFSNDQGNQTIARAPSVSATAAVIDFGPGNVASVLAAHCCINWQ